MQIEVKLDGRTVVNADLELDTAMAVVLSAIQASPKSRSATITEDQAQILITKIDGRSVDLLKLIASNGGFATWREMRKVLGIDDEWAEYTTRYGKGITRAFRHITGDNGKLIFWDDNDPIWDVNESEGRVYIDGKALQSLKAVFGL